MTSVINSFMAVELYKAIRQSNLIPNEDIRMHVNAILAGDQSLTELLSAATSWYDTSYSKVQDSLENTL